MVLAVGVAATSTFTPANRAVNRALETFSFDEATSGGAAILRTTIESNEAPIFLPPDEKTLESLRPRPSIVTYVVKPGDSVVRLATSFNVTPETIIWANNLSNADMLPVGQSILILPMSGVLHNVRTGETLETVASRYQIDSNILAQSNGLALDKQLLSSDYLVIPGGRRVELDRATVSSRAVDRTSPNEARPSTGAPAPTTGSPPVVQAPATAPEPPKAIRTSVYEVKEGDTINGIAQKVGVSAITILSLNGISGAAADSVKVGQKLSILPIDGLVHKVADADAVRDLAARYGVETAAIIRVNGLTEPYILQPGQDIVIPGGKMPEPVVQQAPATVSAPAAVAASAAVSVPEPTATSYKVSEGDSVASIAGRFGLEPRVIAQFNGLERADLISPGSTLMIPAGAVARVGASGGALPRSAPVVAPPSQGPIQAAVAMVRQQPARPAAPPPQPVVSRDNWDVVSVASKYLGYAYTWGGSSPGTGFDCSGFTWFAYKQMGRSIPLHDLWGQMQAGSRVGRGSLQAGDLVFFSNTYTAGLSHVGIYIGGNRFIHAGSERTGVTVSSLGDSYWNARYTGATRV